MVDQDLGRPELPFALRGHAPDVLSPGHVRLHGDRAASRPPDLLDRLQGGSGAFTVVDGVGRSPARQGDRAPYAPPPASDECDPSGQFFHAGTIDRCGRKVDRPWASDPVSRSRSRSTGARGSFRKRVDYSNLNSRSKKMPVYGPGSKCLGRTENETEWRRFYVRPPAIPIAPLQPLHILRGPGHRETFSVPPVPGDGVTSPDSASPPRGPSSPPRRGAVVRSQGCRAECASLPSAGPHRPCRSRTRRAFR